MNLWNNGNKIDIFFTPHSPCWQIEQNINLLQRNNHSLFVPLMGNCLSLFHSLFFCTQHACLLEVFTVFGVRHSMHILRMGSVFTNLSSEGSWSCSPDFSICGRIWIEHNFWLTKPYGLANQKLFSIQILQNTEKDKECFESCWWIQTQEFTGLIPQISLFLSLDW